MAGTVTITTTITVTDDDSGQSETLFNKSKQIAFTARGGGRYALTADQTRTIWDPTVEATEATTDFDFLVAFSDGIVDMEFTTNEADANENLSTRRLVADVPYMLGADDAYAGATPGFAGTLDVIDKIRLDEPSSAARIAWVYWFT